MGTRLVRACTLCTLYLPLVLFLVFSVTFLATYDGARGLYRDVNVTVLSRDVDMEQVRFVANRSLVFTNFIHSTRVHAYVLADRLRVSRAMNCEPEGRNLTEVFQGSDLFVIKSPICECAFEEFERHLVAQRAILNDFERELGVDCFNRTTNETGCTRVNGKMPIVVERINRYKSEVFSNRIARCIVSGRGAMMVRPLGNGCVGSSGVNPLVLVVLIIGTSALNSITALRLMYWRRWDLGSFFSKSVVVMAKRESSGDKQFSWRHDTFWASGTSLVLFLLGWSVIATTARLALLLFVFWVPFTAVFVYEKYLRWHLTPLATPLDPFWSVYGIQLPMLSILSDIMLHRRDVVTLGSGVVSTMSIAILCTVLNNVTDLYSFFISQLNNGNVSSNSNAPHDKNMWKLGGEDNVTGSVRIITLIGQRSMRYIWSFGLLLASIILGKIGMRYFTNSDFKWNDTTGLAFMTEILLFFYAIIPAIDIPSFMHDVGANRFLRGLVTNRLLFKRLLTNLVILILGAIYYPSMIS